MSGRTLAASFGLAALSNVMNNLPGLLAGTALQTLQIPDHIRHAVLLGTDLGPNLSGAGSLATVLWLIALRRESGTSAHGFGSVARLDGLIVLAPEDIRQNLAE